MKIDPRDIAQAIMRASTTRGLVEDNGREPSFEFRPPVQLPVTPPRYPEINPNYPGPFLRDPGELDPWEERYRT